MGIPIIIIWSSDQGPILALIEWLSLLFASHRVEALSLGAILGAAVWAFVQIYKLRLHLHSYFADLSRLSNFVGKLFIKLGAQFSRAAHASSKLDSIDDSKIVYDEQSIKAPPINSRRYSVGMVLLSTLIVVGGFGVAYNVGLNTKVADVKPKPELKTEPPFGQRFKVGDKHGKETADGGPVIVNPKIGDLNGDGSPKQPMKPVAVKRKPPPDRVMSNPWKFPIY